MSHRNYTPGHALDDGTSPEPEPQATGKTWVHDLRTSVISCLLTGAVAIPGVLYYSGAKSEAARQEMQHVIQLQASDHDAITRLTGTMQKIVEDHEKSLAIHTADINRLKTEVVPRTEHETHWKADEVWKSEIKADMREQRQDIKEILTNVKK